MTANNAGIWRPSRDEIRVESDGLILSSTDSGSQPTITLATTGYTAAQLATRLNVVINRLNVVGIAGTTST